MSRQRTRISEFGGDIEGEEFSLEEESDNEEEEEEINNVKLLEKYHDIDSNDINQIMELKYKNGDYFIPEELNITVVMESLEIIRNNDYGIKGLRKHVESVDNFSEFMRRSPSLQNARLNNNISNQIDLKPMEGVTGIGTCANCKGNSFSIEVVQARSGDEPMDVNTYCTNCGSHNNIIPPA